MATTKIAKIIKRGDGCHGRNGILQHDIEGIRSFHLIDANALCRDHVVRFLCASLLIDLGTGRVRFLYPVTLIARKVLHSGVDSAW